MIFNSWWSVCSFLFWSAEYLRVTVATYLLLLLFPANVGIWWRHWNEPAGDHLRSWTVQNLWWDSWWVSRLSLSCGRQHRGSFITGDCSPWQHRSVWDVGTDHVKNLVRSGWCLWQLSRSCSHIYVPRWGMSVLSQHLLAEWRFVKQLFRLCLLQLRLREAVVCFCGVVYNLPSQLVCFWRFLFFSACRESHYTRRPGTDVTVTVSKVEIMLHLLLVRWLSIWSVCCVIGWCVVFLAEYLLKPLL